MVRGSSCSIVNYVSSYGFLSEWQEAFNGSSVYAGDLAHVKNSTVHPRVECE
jgi:hypothetical protein